MLRLIILCFVIVAAFPLSSAAAVALSDDAPVSPVVLEAAQMLGMDVARDRARFMAELTRLRRQVRG